MKNKITAALVALLASAAATQAFTGSFQAFQFLNPDSRFQNSAGEFTNGITVRIGNFAPGFDPVANAGNFEALAANFTAYIEGPTVTVGPGAGAYNSGDWANITGQEGAKIHVLANLGAEYGVFTSDAASWTAGNDDPLTGLAINATQVNTALWGSVETGGGGNHLRLQVIPEPSTYLMLITGFAGMFLFLRRRK